MAMWGTLQLTTDGCLDVGGWGALHRAQHIRPRAQTGVWLRVVAGCSRYTTVCTGPNKEAIKNLGGSTQTHKR